MPFSRPDDRDDDPDGDDAASDSIVNDEPDDEFPLGDGTADTEATVWCPYCGEEVEIAVDPGGGPVQRYVEDCAVCCRPWQLTVRFDSEGAAHVTCDADDAVSDD